MCWNSFVSHFFFNLILSERTFFLCGLPAKNFLEAKIFIFFLNKTVELLRRM